MSKHKPRAASHTPSLETEHDALGLERLVFFSDAVFAIAITLLVLEIRLPSGPLLSDDRQLLAVLAGMWQKYLAYALSFLIIGFYWIAHHRKFRYIQRYDKLLLILNLLLLLVIAFMPFPSSVISEYTGPTATILYAAVLLLPGLLMAIIWWYAAWKGQLVSANLDPGLRRRELVRPLLTSSVFLVSIAIALFNPDLARLSWILILPISFITRDVGA